MTKFYFTQQNQIVDVRIKTDVLVNAWQGSVVVPENLKVARILTAESVTDIWQTRPRLEDGKIVFVGGKPNGFTGEGMLFQIILERGEGELSFTAGTAAYLNDGSGTKTESIYEPLIYSLSPQAPINVRIDNNPPQPFEPVIYRDKKLFNGRPVALFETRDFESGISHYEVRELTTAGLGDWQVAESPYLINSDVKTLEIKAVDAFGNERVAILDIAPQLIGVKMALIFILTALGLVLLYNLIRRRLRK